MDMLSGASSTFPMFWSACDDSCKRAGAYRLARLAVKFGSEILLDDLLLRLSTDCPWRDDPRGTCGVRFADLPPDLPPVMLRLRIVKGGKGSLCASLGSS
jgi:hypothetical protein